MAGSKLERLQEFLARNPGDSFARYGLAMELRQLGRFAEAREHFETLLARDPQYTPAYYHFGMLLLDLGEGDQAVRIFRTGIAVAQAQGNLHARDELQAALALLEGEKGAGRASD